MHGWTWVATVVMLFGSWKVGDKNKFGFLCQLFGNAVWAVQGFKTDDNPLICCSLCFCALYIRNFVEWSRKEKQWTSSATASRKNRRS